MANQDFYQANETGNNGIFGQDVDPSEIRSYRTDPNAYQYGGMVGGAAQQANLYQQQANAMAGSQSIGSGAFGQNVGQSLALQRQAALGQGPSVAQQQLQQGMQQAVAGQQSQAASARGPAALAMAQQTAAGNIAATQQATNAQAGQLRAQEMQNAQQNYAQNASSLSTNQQQLNQQGQLASQGMANQINAQQLQAQMQQQQDQAANYNAAQNLYYNVQTQNAAQNNQAVGGLVKGAMSSIGGAAGGLIGMSDERVKQDIYGVGGLHGVGGFEWGHDLVMSDARAKEDAYAAGAQDMMRQQAAMYAAPGPAELRAQNDEFRWGSDRGPSNRGGIVRENPFGVSDAEADQLATWGRGMGRSQAAMYGMPGGAPSEMLDHLDPYAFRYKPGVPGTDPNEQHYGIMAQDAEQSPMGSTLVRETPYGKAIDTNKATMANLAATTDLHDRVRDLEAERMAREQAAMYGSTGPAEAKANSDILKYNWGY